MTGVLKVVRRALPAFLLIFACLSVQAAPSENPGSRGFPDVLRAVRHFVIHVMDALSIPPKD